MSQYLPRGNFEWINDVNFMSKSDEKKKYISLKLSIQNICMMNKMINL